MQATYVSLATRLNTKSQQENTTRLSTLLNKKTKLYKLNNLARYASK